MKPCTTFATRSFAIHLSLAALALTPSFANAADEKEALSPQAESCQALERIDFEAAADNPVKIIKATYVTDLEAADDFRYMFERRGVVQGAPTEEDAPIPSHCRIEGYIAPAVKFLLALPDAGNWNNRFIYDACEAFCGAVEEDAVYPLLARGAVAMTSDGGHINKRPFDAVWGHNNREGEIDFFHRAPHVSAQAAKAITKAYYGKPYAFSYITGFSKGGHAGLKSALTYPKDYNGVLSRAPTPRYQEVNTLPIPYYRKASHREDGTPILYADAVPLIHKAAVKACDEVDGAKDGVIDDPRKCDYDPGVLLCTEDQTPGPETCLTEEQVEVLRKFYAIPTSEDGVEFYPYPLEVGSEYDWAGFHLPRDEHYETYDEQITRTYLRYLAFEDDPGASYDPMTFDPVKDRHKLDALAPMIDAFSGDLHAFQKAGGKLIIVHSWGDGGIGPRSSIDWYELVRKETGDKKTKDSVRLFVTAGTPHGGSPTDGPHVNDTLDLIIDWVENGAAPNELILRDTIDPTKATRTRPFYPYPAISRYKGAGDVNDAASFEKIDP